MRQRKLEAGGRLKKKQTLPVLTVPFFRTEKLIQNRNVGKGAGKRRSYHKKDQGHLQRQRK